MSLVNVWCQNRLFFMRVYYLIQNIMEGFLTLFILFFPSIEQYYLEDYEQLHIGSSRTASTQRISLCASSTHSSVSHRLRVHHSSSRSSRYIDWLIGVNPGGS